MSPRRTPAPSRLRLEALETRTLLSTCHVTRLLDTGAGQGLRGDLRYCITYANNNPGPDAIDFKVTGTINLTGALPDLKTDIDLQGPGARDLTVRLYSAIYPVFHINSGSAVSFSGLTVTNGSAGISNYGTASIDSCTVAFNNIGVVNYGTSLTVKNSTISDNHGEDAAGIYSSAGNLTVSNSTISRNSSDNIEGSGCTGIYSSYSFTIEN